MNKRIKPPRLATGDTIGLISPCGIAKPDYLNSPIAVMENIGYRVKLGANIYKTTHGYAASPEERAADFNDMIADPEVRMIFFGGGEVCNEILPYVDFEAVRINPKIISSLSDSTTILNAVTALTGLVTFYGATPRMFDPKFYKEYKVYNYDSFRARLSGVEDPVIPPSGPWKIIRGGTTSGELLGGYTQNIAMMLGGKYFPVDTSKKYLLFIEDHIMFSPPDVVSKYLTHLAERGLFDLASGLIFGHYATEIPPELDRILERIAERYQIPVVRNDDFGHGLYNAIIPIGINATLDADKQTFTLSESGVE
ncbi:MAG: LD-carboxypeptidase [Oscillospiraceae bacterium]|jgi:muramoyltetrapeptide carboxypeptidase|nr:LD-carboxypeptidase [Oscillospiraceae bacterium]